MSADATSQAEGGLGDLGAKGRGGSGGTGRRYSSRCRMCSLGRANVFSFWPNVFTFGPDVFSLAGNVFSFRRCESPGVQPCGARDFAVRPGGRGGARDREAGEARGGSTGSPGTGMGPGPPGLNWNAGDQVEPPPTHGRGIAVGKSSPPGAWDTLRCRARRWWCGHLVLSPLPQTRPRPRARRSADGLATSALLALLPELRRLAGRTAEPVALHARIARTGAVPGVRWFRAHECMRRGVHRSRRGIGSAAQRIGDYRRLLDRAL